MRLTSFALGVCCLTFAMIGGVLEGDYAKACWFLIIGLVDLHIATKGA